MASLLYLGVHNKGRNTNYMSNNMHILKLYFFVTFIFVINCSFCASGQFFFRFPIANRIIFWVINAATVVHASKTGLDKRFFFLSKTNRNTLS